MPTLEEAWILLRKLEAKLPKGGRLVRFEHQYVFTANAGVGADVATGDHQGTPHITSSKQEFCLELYTHFEVAPTGADAIVQIEFSNSDDFETASTWMEVARVNHTAGQKTVRHTTFTTRLIPRKRWLVSNVDQVGSTLAGQEASAHLRTERLFI